jgi:SAM-dependent methyltransferase
MTSSVTASERQMWDRHWRSLHGGSAFFGRLTSWVRRRILRHAVRHYAELWLPAEGVLVEAGCGTGEASAALTGGRRRLIGLDLSLSVLLAGRGKPPYDLRVVGDLRALPLADGGVDGIWNLGVLEHFPAEEGVALVRELGRTLRTGGTVLLFWPPTFGLSRWVLAPFEALRSVATGTRFRFFPDEVNRLRSRHHGQDVLAAAGLVPVAAVFGPRDAFVHVLLVGRKPAGARQSADLPKALS